MSSANDGVIKKNITLSQMIQNCPIQQEMAVFGGSFRGLADISSQFLITIRKVTAKYQCFNSLGF